MSIRVNIEISAEKPQDLSPVEQAVLRALSGGTLELTSTNVKGVPALKDAVDQAAAQAKKAAPVKKATPAKPEPKAKPEPVEEPEAPAEEPKTLQEEIAEDVAEDAGDDILGTEAPTLKDAMDRATALVSAGKAAQVKAALGATSAKRVSALEGDDIAKFIAALEG